MTNCEFLYRGENCVGFSIKGHIGLGVKGKDIVCAAVSAVSQATLIGLEEVVGERITYRIEDGLIECFLNKTGDCSQKIVETLHKTLVQLSKQYPKNLSVAETEVQR